MLVRRLKLFLRLWDVENFGCCIIISLCFEVGHRVVDGMYKLELSWCTLALSGHLWVEP